LQVSAQPEPVLNLFYQNESRTCRGPHANADRINIWIF